ncbi:MAG: hypothetical protein ACT6T3_21940, partial [Agrobacterium sp.]|uniref:hypothetical protein n=1 Tax=Agrobacterium sp. TaxID=361 RepID=UPI004033D027
MTYDAFHRHHHHHHHQQQQQQHHHYHHHYHYHYDYHDHQDWQQAHNLQHHLLAQALPLGSDAELQALQAKVHLLQKQLAASEQDSCVARASAAAAAAANATAHSLGAMQTQLQEVSSAQHSVAELRVQLAQRDS